MDNEQTTVPARFRVSPELDKAITEIAAGEGKTKSAVYRDLILLGLSAGGYRSGGQDIANLVREAVTAALRPQTERLASISAKAAQISAAAFFLAAYTGKRGLTPEEEYDFDAVAANARKLGAEYLKLTKDRNLDDFIGKALERMDETT